MAKIIIYSLSVYLCQVAVYLILCCEGKELPDHAASPFTFSVAALLSDRR